MLYLKWDEVDCCFKVGGKKELKRKLENMEEIEEEEHSQSPLISILLNLDDESTPQ